MRELNRNERLLAALFGAVIFLVANFVGMRWIMQQTAVSRAEIARLKSEGDAARNLLKMRPYWTERQTWVAAHPPEAYDEKTSRSKYVQDVLASVETHKLKAESPQALETERDGRLAVVGMELTVEGQLEAIVRWLHELQQPGKYELVRSFTLRQGEDGNTMQAVVRLGKVFRAGDLAAYP